MCGIVAYAGHRPALPVLLRGLKRLEYRGYDSAGISLQVDDLKTYKKQGKVNVLEDGIPREMFENGQVGIGHTRWATHGMPSDHNAHPHLSNDGSIAVVHNGIIENYQTLKSLLLEAGYIFHSETDTEVISNLIQYVRESNGYSTIEALKGALRQVIGAYAIVVIDKENPEIVIGARKSSPLVFGIGENEYFLASDVAAVADHTDRFVFLEDHHVVSIERNNGYRISDIEDNEVIPEIQTLEIKIEQLEKEGYAHFMLKEIFQQPGTIADTMRGRLNESEGWISVGGLNEHMEKILAARRIILVACGTSWHTALIGEYLFEDLARINCEVEYASEFRYRNPILSEEDVVIVISQSGETADTLAALDLAKERGAFTYGLVNVVGSTISRETHSGSYIHAGPEIGVASTKAFTSQVTILCLLAIQLGYQKGRISKEQYRKYISSLDKIPGQVQSILDQDEKIRYIAAEIKSASNALYLGRGYNFPVALEGALKLKEISYIHAEGYPAAEMKHGPIALIDIYMPVVVIANNNSALEKIISNIEEVKARKGLVIAVAQEREGRIRELADYFIEVPGTEEIFSPLLSVIPLQLLAYHIAVMRGCDVDQPRNLAKSVTVE
jgi:glucosamine--fructose-6-phosphate aminotransferase (isomerizing)